MSNFIIYHNVFIVNKQNPAEAGLCSVQSVHLLYLKEKEINLNHTIHKVSIWFSATFFSICISLYKTSGLSKGTLHYRNSVILWQHKQDISPALRKEILDQTTGQVD